MVRVVDIFRQSTISASILGAIVAIACCFLPMQAKAQHFSIVQVNDTLWLLTLETNGNVNTWTLPYPVYRFATADVNGDGVTDAIVGVYKSSRFFTVPSRRVFIFKNFDGNIRPLWLSSRLGGDLVDFTVEGNTIRAIEQMKPGGDYVINDYTWQGFGMGWKTQEVSFKTIDESYQYLNIKKQ